jgi:hypothetical protein
MDQEAIKRALDSFENDKFSDAKDILQKEIRTRKDEFLNDKLGLEEQFEKKEDDDDDDDTDDKDKKKKKKNPFEKKDKDDEDE